MTQSIEFKQAKIELNKDKVLNVGNLSLRGPGSIAIIGKNGAGKTTLLRTLVHMRNLDGGSLSINGSPVEAFSSMELARNLVYIPQSLSTTLNVTSREYINMGLLSRLGLLGFPTKEDNERTTLILDRMGISYLANRSVSVLSGGELRKVALARAAVQGAPTWVLDEVYGPLDISAILEVKGIIESLGASKGLVIFTTHDIQTALCADKVLLVYSDGSVELRPKNGISNTMLNRVYDIPFKSQKMDSIVTECNWLASKSF